MNENSPGDAFFKVMQLSSKLAGVWSSPARTMVTAPGKFPDPRIPEPCGFRALIRRSSMRNSHAGN